MQWKHSHKKRKDILEKRAVLIEIFMLYQNLPSGPKHQGWLQKNIAFPEGNKLFAGDFGWKTGWNKRWCGSIYKEMDLEMDTFAEIL